MTHNSGEDFSSFHNKSRTLKLVIVALALLFTTAVCFFLGAHDWKKSANFSWLGDWPFNDIGAHLLEIIFIVFVFEVYLRRESESAMHALLFSPKIVREILDRKKILEIMQSCFFRLTDDEELSKDMVRIVQDRAVLPKRRCYDLDYDATIRDILPDETIGNRRLHEMFFKVKIICSYKSIVEKTQVSFILARSNEEYNSFRYDESVVWKWLQVVPLDLLEFAGDQFFVESCEIGGIQLKKIASPPGMEFQHLYQVTSEIIPGKIYEHRFSLNVLSRRTGNMMYFNIDYPTKNMRITVDYGRAQIDFMNVVDALATAAKPEVKYLPDQTAPKDAQRVMVRVSDDWVLPKRTTVFVWRLATQKTVPHAT